MKEQILDYYMEWHGPAAKGSILVRTATRRVDFKMLDGNAFSALAAVLSQKPVYTDGALVFTGWANPADEGSGTLPVIAV